MSCSRDCASRKNTSAAWYSGSVAYIGLRGPGLYWIIPLGIERAVTIDIRTRTVSAEQQETITRDSVTVKVNAVLWYRIVGRG